MKTLSINIFSVIIFLFSSVFVQAQEVRGNSTNVNNAGVLGTHSAANGRGVYGESPSGYGVWGFGNLTGVTGESQTGNGVVGKSNGGGVGVYGESAGFNAIRGIGKNKNHGAVVGIHEGGGIAIYGESAQGAGIMGKSTSWTGVYGESATFEGVRGYTKSRDHGGVVGIGANVGVYGKSEDANGLAIWADGHMKVTGKLLVNGIDFQQRIQQLESTINGLNSTVNSLNNTVNDLKNKIKNMTAPGTQITICATGTVPSGWAIVGYTLSGGCGATGSTGQNAWIIQKL